MTNKKNRSNADIEWAARTLCSDESCIGVIGPDGRCKECGKAFEGEFTPGPPPPQDMAETEDAVEDAVEDAAEELLEEDPDGAGDSDWASRTLCSDESCIGVIGPDGRCKECGKPLDDEAV